MSKLSRLFNRNPASKDSFWQDFLKRNGYPEKYIPDISVKLEKLPEDLKTGLKRWDATGILPDIEAEGFSVKELVDEGNFQEIPAFLMIDWLRREPEEARQALAEPITKVVMDEKGLEAIVRGDEIDG